LTRAVPASAIMRCGTRHPAMPYMHGSSGRASMSGGYCLNLRHFGYLEFV
jgi:hypothetical protein